MADTTCTFLDAFLDAFLDVKLPRTNTRIAVDTQSASYDLHSLFLFAHSPHIQQLRRTSDDHSPLLRSF